MSGVVVSPTYAKFFNKLTDTPNTPTAHLKHDRIMGEVNKAAKEGKISESEKKKLWDLFGTFKNEEMLNKIKNIVSGKGGTTKQNAYYYMQYADEQAENKSNTEKQRNEWRKLHMKLVNRYHDYIRG